MFKISSRVIYSVLFYLLLMILIYVSKPSVLFDEKGNVRIFGIGDDKTMFSLGVLTVVIAVVSFYIFCIIDLVFQKPV
jgi:hypothetical protein